MNTAVAAKMPTARIAPAKNSDQRPEIERELEMAR